MASNLYGIKAIHGSNTPHIFGHSTTPLADLLEVWSGNADSTQVLKVHKNGDLIMGPDSSPAIATTATGGFLIGRGCAGAPTGVPDNYVSGHAVFVYDTTNNALYVYNGSWRSVSLT